MGELIKHCQQIVIKSGFVVTPNPTGMGNENDHHPDTPVVSQLERRRLREFPDEPI